MKKLIGITLAFTQLGVFTPAHVLAIESSGRPTTSDVGTSQNNAQNPGTINNNQLGNLQTTDNRLLQPQNSTQQILSQKATGGLIVKNPTPVTLQAVDRPKIPEQTTTPRRVKISPKVILIRGLIIAVLIVVAVRLFNYYQYKKALPKETPALEPITKIKPKKKKKKNVGHKRR